MKYDDSEYYFLNFETDRDNDDAATHIGMYLAWAMTRGLAGEELNDPEATALLAQLRARKITGRRVLLDHCDGKLTDDDLSDVGNAFTQAYYHRHFVKDYERVFQGKFPDTGHPTADFCGIPDTWDHFQQLAALLDRRYAQWQQARKPGNDSGGGSGAAAAAGTTSTAAKAAAAPTQPSADASRLSLEALSPRSPDELRRRGESGDAEAWYELAGLHITGEGAAQDFALAVAAFRRAAELGHVQSAYNLGVACQNGDGVPQDPQQALHWFTIAADAGHGFSALMLAQAYRKGEQLPQDLALANALSMLAVMRGVREARNFGIVAGNDYAELVMAIKEPGSLRPVLEQRRTQVRRAAPGSAPSGALPDTPHANRNSTRRIGNATAPTSASGAPSVTGAADSIGLIATAIGAVAVFVLLMFATSLSTATFRALAFAFAAIGAFGVFRSSGTLGHGTAKRLLLTLLAAIPAGGAFVCMLVLWWRFRRSQG